MPARRTWRASSLEGAALLGVPSLTVEQGLAGRTSDRSRGDAVGPTLEVDVDRERAPLRRLVRALPALVGRLRRASRRCCRSSPSSASTSSTCRRSTRSASPTARARTTRSPARRATPAARGRSAAQEGGHTAIAPGARDARRLRAARRRGARARRRDRLDFAIQCSPDHPWLREHPEWFHRRPDGTLKYAENPPKRYQDIYNVNFDCEDWRGALGGAPRRRPSTGSSAASACFRVDNPHTKPLAFWEWLIARGARRRAGGDLPGRGVHAAGDDGDARQDRLQPVLHVLHLEEHALGADRLHARADLGDGRSTSGRTSSPTRRTSSTSTCRTAAAPAFEARLVLAATLSPSYGIYSGFELCENEPREAGQRGVPGLGEVRGRRARGSTGRCCR